jgi:uncharacterized damage-inducible protein DinB
VTGFDALSDTLRRLGAAIRPITAHEFTARPFAASGSIGEHVRHCLDHVAALERGIATGEVCYDHRARNTVVERAPALAMSRIVRAAARLGALGDELLQRRLTLTAQVHDDGRMVRTTTTVGRELAFVISHTIHHSAIVAVLLERAGQVRPSRLGIAPTTPALRPVERSAEALCAR